MQQSVVSSRAEISVENWRVCVSVAAFSYTSPSPALPCGCELATHGELSPTPAFLPAARGKSPVHPGDGWPWMMDSIWLGSCWGGRRLMPRI